MVALQDSHRSTRSKTAVGQSFVATIARTTVTGIRIAGTGRAKLEAASLNPSVASKLRWGLKSWCGRVDGVQ